MQFIAPSRPNISRQHILKLRIRLLHRCTTETETPASHYVIPDITPLITVVGVAKEWQVLLQLQKRWQLGTYAFSIISCQYPAVSRLGEFSESAAPTVCE